MRTPDLLGVDATAGGEALAATKDALFGGNLVLYQPPRGAGYRTNVDALVLAAFASSSTRQASCAFDLGAGVGAVGLVLLRLGASKRVVLVEVDALAAEMAQRNLEANGWPERGEVVVGDVCEVARRRRGEASLVVCNPPYVVPGRGRSPKDAVRARARSGRLEGFVEAARTVAGRRARVCFVYPAHDLTALMAALRAQGLEPKRLRFVHATTHAPARVALVEAQPAKAGGLVVLPPLVERDARGYSPEMHALLTYSACP
jgi:tRNA1Val (adenine37-N6)-methyltransferase